MDEPVRFDEWMDRALYGPEGFYNAGGKAGRRGDFITSPEVGPLFGAVLARMIDAEWRRLGEPSSFTVVDAGAGPGTLSRGILSAEPDADLLAFFRELIAAAAADFAPEILLLTLGERAIAGRHAVVVVLTARPGPFARFGDVDIAGNGRVSAAVIRRRN